MSSVIEHIDLIEVTDEDIKEFIPDKVLHLVQTRTWVNDGIAICGAKQGTHECPGAGQKHLGGPVCDGCGMPICSFCLLLNEGWKK